MKLLVVLASFLLSPATFASANDSVVCKLSVDGGVSLSIHATYDDHKVTILTESGGASSTSTGVGYQTMSKSEISKDEQFLNLVQSTGLPFSQVDHASVFIIDRNNEGSSAIIKLLDKNGANLGSIYVGGFAAIACGS